MSARVPIWPTHAGDHRAAHRSAALGAMRGRVRFKQHIQGVRVTLVDALSRIAAVGETEVTLLDSNGSVSARFAVPAWTRVVSTSQGLLMAHGRELVGRTLAGAELFRELARGEVTHVQVAPDGAPHVWTQSGSDRIEVESEITRYEKDAAIGWSIRHALSAAGYVSVWSMAFDDAGALYALCGGRLGDGVSGGDVATGGLAAYRRSGELAFTLPESGGHARRLHARARGVLLHGSEVRAYGPSGELDWKLGSERLAAPTKRLRQLDLELVEQQAPEPLPLLANRAPGSYFQIHAATDGAGNRYFVHAGRVACVDPELRLGWALRVRGLRDWVVPAIGPDASVLIASDGELLAIE